MGKIGTMASPSCQYICIPKPGRALILCESLQGFTCLISVSLKHEDSTQRGRPGPEGEFARTLRMNVGSIQKP